MGFNSGFKGLKTRVNLTKHETAVKMNYTNTCKNVYTFLLKEEDILEATQSKRKCFFNSNNKPNLINQFFFYFSLFTKCNNTFHFYVYVVGLATVSLPWQHWTKALVCFDDVDISAFHSCVVVDLWQSLSGIYYCLRAFWCAVARMSELELEFLLNLERVETKSGRC